MPIKLANGDGRVVDGGYELIDGDFGAVEEFSVGHGSYVLFWVATIAEELEEILCGGLEN